MKRLFIIFIICFGWNIVYSQSYNSYYHQFEMRANYGLTIPHHTCLKYLIEKNIYIGEITYSIKTDGSEPWQHVWRFPELGVGYLMGSLGNINVFGFSQSLYAFYGVPIVETDNFIFKYRFGCGLAYVSEKFDARANYFNVAFVSYLNAHLHFSLLVDYQFPDIPLYLTAGFAYNHFSSGAIETPNLGLNQVTGNFGVKYMYSMYNYSLPKRTVPYQYDKDFEFSAYYAVSVKENSTYENKKYIINSLICDFASRLNNQRSLGVGLNLIFDPSIKPLLEEDYTGAHNLLRVGVHAMQEVYLTDDLSVIMHLGTYAFNKYKDGKKILVYSKLGVRYTFAERYFANIVLKTHTTTADYIEFGLGFRIN